MSPMEPARTAAASLSVHTGETCGVERAMGGRRGLRAEAGWACRAEAEEQELGPEGGGGGEPAPALVSQ